MNDGLVYTNEKCVGCSKCISVCSAMGACVSTDADENGACPYQSRRMIPFLVL